MKIQQTIFLFFFLSCFIGLIFIPLVFADIEENATDDTWVFSAKASENYGSDPLACAGYETGYRNVLFDFNITRLVNAYNDYGYTPSEVFIRFRGILQQFDPIEDLHLNADRITEDWDEDTMDFNEFSGLSYQPILGENYITIDGNLIHWQYHYINITDDFLDVLDNNGTDFYGYCLIGNSSVSLGYSDTQYLIISTKEGADTPVLWYGAKGTEESEPYYPPFEMEEEPFLHTEYGANFIVLFFMIFVPPLMLAGAFSQRNISPAIGFIGGLCLTVSIGFISGLMPLWFLFVCIMVIVLFLFMIFKRGF